MTTLTIDNIDMLLDSGRLEIAMRSGRWWTLRRNGATKRWKTDPTRIRVSVKAGMYAYDCIASHRLDLPAKGGHLLDSPYLRIKE